VSFQGRQRIIAFGSTFIEKPLRQMNVAGTEWKFPVHGIQKYSFQCLETFHHIKGPSSNYFDQLMLRFQVIIETYDVHRNIVKFVMQQLYLLPQYHHSLY